VNETLLLLGIDGGGTQCRARLCTPSGAALGVGRAGPANIRLGLDESFAAILAAAVESLEAAGLSSREFKRTVACLALAGASEPTCLSAARRKAHPFRSALITTDAHAACVGAHGGRDGGVIVIGTGTIGWAVLRGQHHRVGGWGFPASDEGSGAWLGCEAVRHVLSAHDGRTAWTGLLVDLFEEFGRDPHALVRFATDARPRDFGRLAPRIVAHAQGGDATAIALMRRAAGHIDVLADRLRALGVPRLALVGGLAPHLAAWLSDDTQAHLTPALGDASSGAVALARAHADTMAEAG